MTITGWELHRKGASGNDTGTVRTYQAVYRVFSNSALDQAAQVLYYFYTNAGTLPNPALRTTYAYGNDYDLGAYCNRLSVPERLQGSCSPWIFEVTADFTTELGNGQDGGGGVDKDGNPTNNPLDFRPDIQTSFVMVQRPCWKAIYEGGYTGALAGMINIGDELTPMSSAQRAFDPPLEKETPLLRVSVTVNLVAVDTEIQLQYINRTNSTDISLVGNFGYSFSWNMRLKKDTAKLNDYKTVIKRESFQAAASTTRTIDYLALTAELLVDPDGWFEQVPDRDIHRTVNPGDPDGRGGTISFTDILGGMPPNERIRGPGGDLVAGPVFLDGNGQPLQGVITPDKIVYLKWRKVKSAALYNAPALDVVFNQ